MKDRRNDKGMALVIALVMLLTLTIMGIAAITTTTVEIQIAGNERFSLQAMNLADAGIERALLDLTTDYKIDGDWADAKYVNLSSGSNTTVTLPNKYITFPDGGKEPNVANWGDPFNASPSAAGIVGNAVAPYGKQTMGGDGYYIVLILRDSGKTGEVWSRVYAMHPTGSRKVIQLHLQMEKVDAWHNAVFAGMGSATASVQGNIKINGPVHLLGQGDTNAWSVKGNAEQTNGYKDLGDPSGTYSTQALFNRLPPPEIVDTYNGQPVYSLGSVLRVKNAQVAIEGSANLGEAGGGGGVPAGIADYGGYYFQSKLEGVYSNTEIKGTNLDAKIHAEEIQVPGGYDLGDKVQMPTFEDPYTDEHGNKYATYKEYIQQQSIDVDGAANPERCTLNPGTPGDAGVTNAFAVGNWQCAGIAGLVNSTTPSATVQDISDLANCTCKETTGCMLWKPDAGTYPSPVSSAKSNMKVEGRVEFKTCANGLKLGQKPDGTAGGGDIVYEGAGIFYAPSPVSIDGSLVTKAKNADGTARTFTNIKDEAPADGNSDGDLLGIMTTGSMEISRTSTGEVVMGAFFSSESVGIRMVGDIIGSLVANRYCMGKTVNLTTNLCGNESGNAPDIHYVDQLADSIQDLGMIKSKIVYTFGAYDWQEVY